ncbi:MAG: cupin protein [Rhodospirillales bacterium]|nr:cupin protein [Rhodospirillales bacterium]
MTDKSVTKVEAGYAPLGPQGQRYLANGRTLSMRLWEHEPAGEEKPQVQRAYETAGYVIAGRAELRIEGQTVMLEPGSSWIVPKEARHSYRILEDFTAVEATTPPAEVHDRDAVSQALSPPAGAGLRG